MDIEIVGKLEFKTVKQKVIKINYTAQYSNLGVDQGT